MRERNEPRACQGACGKTAVESVVETAPFLANHRDAVKEFILDIGPRLPLTRHPEAPARNVRLEG
jgi:hypothetical protein